MPVPARPTSTSRTRPSPRELGRRSQDSVYTAVSSLSVVSDEAASSKTPAEPLASPASASRASTVGPHAERAAAFGLATPPPGGYVGLAARERERKRAARPT